MGLETSVSFVKNIYLGAHIAKIANYFTEGTAMVWVRFDDPPGYGIIPFLLGKRGSLFRAPN